MNCAINISPDIDPKEREMLIFKASKTCFESHIEHDEETHNLLDFLYSVNTKAVASKSTFGKIML